VPEAKADLMAPNNQNGGGRGPWGQGGPGNQSDLEALLKRGQDKLKQAMPGGSGVSGIDLVSRAIRGQRRAEEQQL